MWTEPLRRNRSGGSQRTRMKGGVCEQGYSLGPIGSSPGPYGGVSTGCEPRLLGRRGTGASGTAVERSPTGYAAGSPVTERAPRREDRQRVEVRQYSLAQILAVWAAAAVQRLRHRRRPRTRLTLRPRP